jgi:hypothetical protein
VLQKTAPSDQKNKNKNKTRKKEQEKNKCLVGEPARGVRAHRKAEGKRGVYGRLAAEGVAQVLVDREHLGCS